MTTQINATAVKRRVLLVDDHPIVREGMTLLLNQQSDIEVCGAAADAEQALEGVATLAPDLVILDISLGGPDGLEVLKRIRARMPELPVLMLSMHDESDYAERSIRAGANGYIMKQEALDKVLTAIHEIFDGGIYLSERAASRVLQNMSGRRVSAGAPTSKMSDRELEVFRMIGEGRSTRQIAETLGLSVKTVETHEAHLKEKLGVGSLRELMQRAVEWNLSRKS